MNSLDIQEQREEFFIVLSLTGELIQENVAKLKIVLDSLLEEPKPEFILLECGRVTNIEPKSLESLKKIAIFFSEQARELAMCNLARSLYIANFFSPPLSYYPSQADAIKSFLESMPNKNEGNELVASSDLLLQRRPMLKLSVLQGDKRISVYLKDQQELTIGRHSKCSLCLPQNIQISRFHCKCYRKEGKFYLEDMNSANGTIFCNNFIDESVEIRDGDRFLIGDVWVDVSVVGEKNNNEKSGPNSELPDIKMAESIECDEKSPLNLPKIDVPGTYDDGFQTKFGVKFSELIAEEEDTVHMSVDQKKLANLYSKFVLGDTTQKTSKPQEKKTYELIQRQVTSEKTSVPVLIMRSGRSLSPGQSILQYKIQETIGESSTSFMYRVTKITNSSISLFLQYAKESMVLEETQNTFPHLLLPCNQGKWDEKWFRIFTEVTPVSSPPISEFKIVEIGLGLIDTLLYFRNAGQFGFDIAACHIFYDKGSLPKFAIVPAVIYTDLQKQKADIFTLGTLLLKLATGLNPPCNSMRFLENEKIIIALEQAKISLALGKLILEILNFQEVKLEAIIDKLRDISCQLLTPGTNEGRTICLEMLTAGESIISNFTSGKMERLPYSRESSTQSFPQLALPSIDNEQLLTSGQRVCREFLPRKFISALAQCRAKYLQLSLDEELMLIPWELAHDGKDFLAHQFATARDLMIERKKTEAFEVPLAGPRIFILADIAPWAQEIKEMLVDMFRAISNVKLNVSNTSQRPLDIVQNMFQSDIFHVIGTWNFDHSDCMDSGWTLSPRKNLFKIRLLENASKTPRLICCQSQIESYDNLHRFLMALQKTGVPHILSNSWTLRKNEVFLNFYQHLFKKISVGEAVRQTRNDFADDPKLSLSLMLYGHSTVPLIAK